MRYPIYIDTIARKPVNPDGTQAKFPNLIQGDSVEFELHGLEPNSTAGSFGNVYTEVGLSFTTIKCGIGPGADAGPANGTFRVGLVGDVGLLGMTQETTAPLASNITQADFLAAINALQTVQAVSSQGLQLDIETPQAVNFFYIRWVDPTITAQFQLTENRLEPYCFVRSYTYALANGQLQMLKFIVAPFAFSDQFAYPSLEGVTTDSVRVGTGNANCVQSITVPDDAIGSFTLSFASNATEIISVADVQGALTDGSQVLADALNQIYSDNLIRFSVTKQDTGLYYVEMVGVLAKTDYPVMGVTMHGQVPVNTPLGTLNLDGPAIELALHGQKQITLLLEIEIDTGTDVSTPVQVSIVVVNDMIDSAMALALDPNYLVPAGPAYPPYNPGGATIMAPGAYVTPIGSGVAVGTGGTSFVVTHNLGTSNVLVGVRETGGTHHRIPDNEYVCTIVNDNQVQIDFPVAPTNGQYEIIIAAVVPAAMALPYFTIQISQVVGLQAILTALLAGTNPLDLWPSIPDGKLPVHISWYNTNADGTQGALRFDVVPDALIPGNIPRLVNGVLDFSVMPPGIPYIGADGGLYVNLPGPPPVTVQILDPTGHIPTSTLPLDPSTWGGLIKAILAALQGGASLPNTVVFDIPDLTESFPPPFALNNHCSDDSGTNTVPSSVLPALINLTNGGTVSGGLPPPSTVGYANNYFTVTGGASSSATIFRETQGFQDGDVIASNGYQWYKIFLTGNTAYPQEYHRELFSLYVAPDMLSKGSRFSVDFTLQAQFTTDDLIRAQYILTLEIGSPLSLAGANVGANISSVDWYTKIVQETIILSNANTYHHFGYAVGSDATTGAYSATKTVYAASNLASTAPISPGFLVRATLTKFDVENTVANPTGQINLKMLKALASVVKPQS